jgi:hypothetical protein
LQAQLIQFNMGEDCPVFDGLYDFCRRRAPPPLPGCALHA